MNDKFDELAKGPAGSVTRRGALKKFGLGLTGIALVMAAPAMAADLYVDANANGTSDGSAASPYARITDAVGRARQLRQSAAIPLNERIVIHVAPGSYAGTFNTTPLDNSANKEVLPIILNVPNLTLAGSTVLDHDERGLPTGPQSDHQTKLKASDLVNGDVQALVVIGRTTDGGAGDGVTVTGFTFGENNGGLGVVVDRVSDFTVLDNAFSHSSISTLSRLSSGTVGGNYFALNNLGPAIGGGSSNHPAHVSLARNRCTKGNNGADIRGSPTMRVLDTGANALQFEALQLVYDRNNTQDLANLPDSLDIVIENNDFSGNKISGLFCFFYAFNPAFAYTTADESQPKTAVAQATIRANTFTGNGDYGWVVEAGGSVRGEPRLLTAGFTGIFSENAFQGNRRAPALFAFIAGDVSLGAASIQAFKYLQNSTYQVTDLDGELTGFDYDNPATDPVSGTVLNNALVVNGVTIPPNAKITSPKK